MPEAFSFMFVLGMSCLYAVKVLEIWKSLGYWQYGEKKMHDSLL